jgi:hypothetical protein
MLALQPSGQFQDQHKCRPKKEQPNSQEHLIYLKLKHVFLKIQQIYKLRGFSLLTNYTDQKMYLYLRAGFSSLVANFSTDTKQQTDEQKYHVS